MNYSPFLKESLEPHVPPPDFNDFSEISTPNKYGEFMFWMITSSALHFGEEKEFILSSSNFQDVTPKQYWKQKKWKFSQNMVSWHQLQKQSGSNDTEKNTSWSTAVNSLCLIPCLQFFSFSWNKKKTWNFMKKCKSNKTFKSFNGVYISVIVSQFFIDKLT